jgi:hypothetical protein
VQVPIGIWQGLTFGWTDPVQGTLVGSGAGAHILAALFALSLLIAVGAMLSGRLSRVPGVLMSLAALGMIIAAGANQVVMALTPALIATPMLGRATSLGRMGSSRFAARVGTTLLILTLAISGLVLAQTLSQSTVLRRTERLVLLDQLPETQLVRERAEEQRLELLIGSGPGTTASRASLLLTPTMLKETSPLAILHLPPTQDGLRIVAAARESQGGSAESFASGSLGILGDLGLVGFIGMAVVFIGAWRQIARAQTWLKPTAQASILMTSILLFVDNWLEYPEYAVPLAILVAFAMRSGSEFQTTKSSA